MSTKVLVVDRLEYLLGGISDMLRRHLDVQIVAAISNYEQILRYCHKLQPDVLIIDPDDLQHSFNWGILKRIRAELPHIRIIVFTDHYTGDIINHAMNKIGVKGFVSKNDSQLSSLVDSIKYISQGTIYIDPRLQSEYLKENGDENDLTGTQLNVFLGVSQGKSKKEIADDLELTERYVGNIVQEIRRKLNAKNDVELVHQALKKGLIEVRNKILRSSKVDL